MLSNQALKGQLSYCQLLNEYQNSLALLLNKFAVMFISSSLLPRAVCFSLLMTHSGTLCVEYLMQNAITLSYVNEIIGVFWGTRLFHFK